MYPDCPCELLYVRVSFINLLYSHLYFVCIGKIRILYEGSVSRVRRPAVELAIRRATGVSLCSRSHRVFKFELGILYRAIDKKNTPPRVDYRRGVFRE